MFNNAAFFTVHLFDTKYGQHDLISFKMIKCKKNADIPNGVAMVRQSVNMGWRSNRKCGVHVSPLYILQCGSKFTCTVCSLMQHNNNYMPTLAHKTDCSILGDWAHLMLLVAIFFFASSARIKKKGESFSLYDCWSEFRWYIHGSTSPPIKTKWFIVCIIILGSAYLQIRQPCLPPFLFPFIFPLVISRQMN